MKKVYGYIRVSTVKQGTGVSLQEQKEAIVRYAEKHNLTIAQWFEELETAAKQGRPLFNKVIKLLKEGKGQGVIIHKIDRSARNLKDWAVLGDLIDQNVDVHFAHESLDLDTRGGRLAADIQAVIASDYIRNLRDEAIKGLYGRLKQGIYPFYAPLGYLNNGGGKVKTIDPVRGPLVKKAFELYANGKYNLNTLAETMQNMGLRNVRGNMVSVTRMSRILHNPFYTGVLRVKGRSFQGAHAPLISGGLFSKVQDILRGKTNTRPYKHDFLFRRMLKCKLCGYSLIGEMQKGHVYYRCHTRVCPTKGIREEAVEKAIIQALADIRLFPPENAILKELLAEAQENWADTQMGFEESLKIQKTNISIWQAAFYTHIIGGGIGLLLGWTQFSARIRKRRLPVHRFIGKIYITACLCAGFAGLYLAVFATGGLVASLGFGSLAMLWILSTSFAFLAIRRKEVEVHQAWMTRSYALAFAAVTLRLWLPLLDLALGLEFIGAYQIAAWLCWVPNLVVAEMIIRSSRVRPVAVAR